MKGFWGSRRGNFALMTALLAVPVFGAAGLAVDYSRATNVKEFVQGKVDAAALNGVHLGPDGDYSGQIAYVRSSVAKVEEFDVAAKWLSPTDFRVVASGVIPLTILAAVPGFPQGVPFSVSATARLSEPQLIYSAPTVAELDPEAGDYNRIYVYCYDPAESANADHGRTKMAAIADNAGTKYDYVMPKCDAGQFLSYKLMNVRDSRTNPSDWDDLSADVDRYEYFTDTTIENGVEQYHLHSDILETVMCDTRDECRDPSDGGILPRGKDRTPERTTEACRPGKYMYYGWEDRPPGSGWTDSDYDDIRVIISCPTVQAVGERSIRLLN